MIKKCSKCNLEKSLEDFPKDKTGKFGRHYKCKACNKEYNKLHYIKNRDRKVNARKEYKANNPEKVKDSNKKYYHKHKKTLREKHKAWVEANKEHVLLYAKEYGKTWQKNKRKYDPLHRLKGNISRKIRSGLAKLNSTKKSTTCDILGCTIPELKVHLLNTYFINYGEKITKWSGNKVHIDHIIPLNSANTEDELLKLWHYTNLQLLKAEDNLKKGAKTGGQND
jgi:hypothetical protein